MTTIEQIKAEIERRYKEFDGKTGDIATASRLAYLDVISFLSTLEESEKPVPKDLEEAAEHYASVTDQEAHGIDFIREVFIAGAEWHADYTPLPEDTVLFNKGVAEGKRLMMEDAVKWLVDDDYDELTDKGRFILGSVGIGYNGYYIPYSDLLKLPKED